MYCFTYPIAKTLDKLLGNKYILEMFRFLNIIILRYSWKEKIQQ